MKYKYKMIGPSFDLVNGEMVAGSAEGLSANIHTGFDGVVKEVTPKGIRISRREA